MNVNDLRRRFAELRTEVMKSASYPISTKTFNEQVGYRMKSYRLDATPEGYVEAAEIVHTEYVKNTCYRCKTTRCPDGCCCAC